MQLTKTQAIKRARENVGNTYEYEKDDFRFFQETVGGTTLLSKKYTSRIVCEDERSKTLIRQTLAYMGYNKDQRKLQAKKYGNRPLGSGKRWTDFLDDVEEVNIPNQNLTDDELKKLTKFIEGESYWGGNELIEIMPTFINKLLTIRRATS